MAGLAGLVPLWAGGFLPPLSPSTLASLLEGTAVRWALGGAAMGLVFAAAVASIERRRPLRSLSLRRFARWGFLAGASIPVGMAMVSALIGQSSPVNGLRAGVLFGGVCGVLGAAVAVASVRAARSHHAAVVDDPSSHSAII
jgi:hypothetical protein